MRVAAASFPFALPARYAGEGHPDDQVAVTVAGETVVYPSVADLRFAVLATGTRTPFAPPPSPAAEPDQTLHTLGALATVAAILGALAGFAMFGLAELHKAGVL